MSTPLRIDFVSDISCPWCAIGLSALEQALARFSGFPAALLFSTGYMANLGVATALLGRGDAVFGDRLNHACLNDGALLSRATFHRHPHGDLAALERQLAGSQSQRCGARSSHPASRQCSQQRPNALNSNMPLSKGIGATHLIKAHQSVGGLAGDGSQRLLQV